jgi:hypothetical protein
MSGKPRGGREVWHGHDALLSLAAGGGDEEDASAGDEAADVRERDLVLVPKAETI